MEYAKCCRDCVLNHDCLLQKDNNVEDCEDYKDKHLDETEMERLDRYENKDLLK